MQRRKTVSACLECARYETRAQAQNPIGLSRKHRGSESAITAGACRFFGIFFVCLIPLMARSESVRGLVGRIRPGTGTAAATAAVVDGRPCVSFPVNLREVTDRCYWDLPVRLDLRHARGVSLRLYCADVSPVSQFNVYLHADGTWHAATFSLSPRRWQTVEIPKSRLRAEGSSRGLAEADTLRIACWKGSARNTSLVLDDLSIVSGDPNLAILRCGGTLGKAQRGEASRYTEVIDEALVSLHLTPSLIDDTDIVQSGIPGGFTVIMVPYLPASSHTAIAALEQYAAGGGHIIGFYECPSSVAACLGFNPGNYTPANRFPGGFAAMAFDGGVVPGIPAIVRQRSGNIMGIAPISGRTRSAGWWLNESGARTEYPALVTGARGSWFSHVYLGKDLQAGPLMLLSVIAQYEPRLWAKTAGNALGTVSYALGYPSFEAARDALSRAAGNNPAVNSALNQAANFYRAALKLQSTHQPVAALDFAEKCRRKLEEAALAGQPARPGEFRGVWCHRGYGIEGWSWEQSASQLRRCGFNALFANMATGGSSWYPSRYLETKSRPGSAVEDCLADCLRACRSNGIQLHVWKLCFSLSGEPESVRQRMRDAGRLQRSAEGAELPWLCPSHPANLQNELAVAREIVTRYPVNGYHLDFIRFPGSNACYCDHCRKSFERYLGHTVSGWPGQVDSDPALREKWQEFRRQTITAYVEQLRRTVKAIRPDITFSAAVFSNWSSARETVGQDWVEWCRKGYLDAVLPMDYVDSAAALRTAVERDLRQLRGTPVSLYPGLGLSSCNLNAIGLFRQIAETRRLGCPGFCVFEFNEAEALGPLVTLAEALKQ